MFTGYHEIRQTSQSNGKNNGHEVKSNRIRVNPNCNRVGQGWYLKLDKQQKIIELVAAGMKNKDIGKALGTTEHMIKNYLRVIYDRLGMYNRVEVALWYLSRREHDTPPRTTKASP